jgi:hypothetical protein
MPMPSVFVVESGPTKVDFGIHVGIFTRRPGRTGEVILAEANEQKFLHYYFRRPKRLATGRDIDLVMPATRRRGLRWNATTGETALSITRGVRPVLRDIPDADPSYPRG